jgi:hypothetical protein
MKINGVSVTVNVQMSKEEYLEAIRNAATEVGCNVKVNEEYNTIEIYSNLYGYEEAIDFSADDNLVDVIGLKENKDCMYVIESQEVRFNAGVPTADDKISTSDGIFQLLNLIVGNACRKVSFKFGMPAGFTTGINDFPV